MPRAGETRDGGQAQFEYLGLILLIAAIIAALVAGSLTSAVPKALRAAICQVIGKECGVSPTRAQRQRPTWLPDRCLVSSNKTTHSTGVKVIAYRHSSKKMTVVKQHSDGSITEITGTTTGNGVDLKLGYGIDYKGKGASIAGGAGVLWNAQEAVKLTFDSAAQAEAFHRRVQEKIGSFMAKAYRKDIPARRHPTKTEMRQRVALEMDIPLSIFTADGTRGYAGFEGSYGVGSAGGGFENATSEGTWYGNNGTADPSDDVTIEAYTLSDKFTWNAGLGIPPGNNLPGPLKGLTAGARHYGEYADGGTFQVKYRDGDPVELIITRKRSWSRRLEAGAGVGGASSQTGGEKSGEATKSTTIADTGGVSVETTVIDLRKHPEALGVFKKWLQMKKSGPPRTPTNLSAGSVWDRAMEWRHEWAQAQEALARHIREHGRTTRRNYARDRSMSSGAMNASASYYLQLLELKGTTARQQLTLKDAQYRDPATGEWKPWVSCQQ